MGCSSSHEAADDPTQAAHPQTTSSPTSRALTAQNHIPTSTSALAYNAASQPSSSPRHSTTSRSHPGRHSSTAQNAQLDTPYNLPLQAPTTTITTPQPWTPQRLARERSDFFDTRVTGRQEVWSAIAHACELVREGQVENARAVLGAAGVSLPTGDLVAGGYDEVGGLYRVPGWCLGAPSNTLDEGDVDGETVVGSLPATGKEKEREQSDDTDTVEKEKRRDEKGKGRAVVDVDAVKVKCRLSDRGGPDVIVLLGRAQPVRVLVNRILDEASVPNTARIRIAYLGKVFNEKETLGAQGWKEGHVLNALVVGQIEK